MGGFRDPHTATVGSVSHRWRQTSPQPEETKPVTVREKIQQELDSIARDLVETKGDFSEPESRDLMTANMDLHQIQNRLREVVTNLLTISSAALDSVLEKEASNGNS